MRTQKLLPNCLLAAACVLPVLVACGGQVSLGTNHSQLSIVDPGAVSGTVPACNPGAAHPNVCCSAAPGKDSQCGVYQGAPFQPCEGGWTAYPDPRSCCSLANPSQCTAPPANPPPSTGGSCGYLCEPGWYPVTNGCCRTTPGGGECYGGGSTGSDGGTFDDGGLSDGGVFDAAVDAGPPDFDSGTNNPPAPPQPTCDLTCPSGWQRPVGAPDVCCRDVGGGEIECFSQATGPGGPGPGPGPDGGIDDAGVSDGGSADAGTIDASPLACGASNNGDCSCQATIGGHNYELQCSDPAQVCTCIVDGVGTSINGVTECSAPDGGAFPLETFWTNGCHFPM